MAQNDPAYAVGDRVLVWTSGTLAAQALAGQLVNDGLPRPATVVGVMPPEQIPNGMAYNAAVGSYQMTYIERHGGYQVEYSDEQGGQEIITDSLRMRLQ